MMVGVVRFVDRAGPGPGGDRHALRIGLVRHDDRIDRRDPWHAFLCGDDRVERLVLGPLTLHERLDADDVPRDDAAGRVDASLEIAELAFATRQGVVAGSGNVSDIVDRECRSRVAGRWVAAQLLGEIGDVSIGRIELIRLGRLSRPCHGLPPGPFGMFRAILHEP
jgi:hypothetical protein